MAKLETAVSAGLQFIAHEQRPDGGFDGLASNDPLTFAKPRLHPTIFFAALIAECCAGLPGGRAITEQAAAYLLKHKSSNWSWNYWQRDDAGQRMRGYPDDLDDTACAILAIQSANPNVIDGSVLGYLGQQLISAEIAVGGPYQTWLVPAQDLDHWYDNDVAVNANIAYMLQRLGIVLPGLEYYLCQALKSDKLQSSYYMSTIPTLYFISRSGLASQRHYLRIRLAAALHDPAAYRRSALATSLLLATACRLGYGLDVLDSLAQSLLISQTNGHWPAAPLYVEPPIKGVFYYAGSAALTTAFACEALELYRQRVDAFAAASSRRSPPKKPLVSPSAHAHAAIEKLAAHIKQPDLRSDYLKAAQTIKQIDRDGQISGLAGRLNRDTAARLTPAGLRHLQVASLNGWMAYTLYDDVLDAPGHLEQGSTINPVHRLGTANLALRQCLEHFRLAIPGGDPFQRFVQDVMNTVDGANTWEMIHARVAMKGSIAYIPALPDYGNYGQLAEKSWGHVLASCGVLVASGRRLDSAELKQWQRFFYHFLIARQLNDDAHDWQDDITHGQLSSVVCMLLGEDQFPLSLDLEHDMSNLRQRFWHKTVNRVCTLIERHISNAETALSHCSFITQPAAYQQLLDELRGAVLSTRRRRSEALAFMESFSTGL